MPCGCAEAKAIRAKAEAEGRPMTIAEAEQALAHDTGMWVEDLRRLLQSRIDEGDAGVFGDSRRVAGASAERVSPRPVDRHDDGRRYHEDRQHQHQTG